MAGVTITKEDIMWIKHDSNIWKTNYYITATVAVTNYGSGSYGLGAYGESTTGTPQLSYDVGEVTKVYVDGIYFNKVDSIDDLSNGDFFWEDNIIYVYYNNQITTDNYYSVPGFKAITPTERDIKKIYSKINGEWIEIKEGYVMVDGLWKKFFGGFPADVVVTWDADPDYVISWDSDPDIIIGQ